MNEEIKNLGELNENGLNLDENQASNTNEVSEIINEMPEEQKNSEVEKVESIENRYEIFEEIASEEIEEEDVSEDILESDENLDSKGNIEYKDLSKEEILE